jgi:hypothetical protein
MRAVLPTLILVSACAGPGQQRLSETPTARTRATPTEAPPASTSDRDRDELVRSNDSMRDVQNAHAEARRESAPPAPSTKGTKGTKTAKGTKGTPLEASPLTSDPDQQVKPKTAPASPDKP